MPSKFHANQELADDLLMAVGSVTVTFAHLESHIAHLAQCFIRGGAGGIVTSQLSFKLLLDLTAALFADQLSDQKDLIGEVDELIRDCGKAEEKRNVVVHFGWGIGGLQMNTVVRTKRRTKRKVGFVFETEDLNLEQVHAIADEIDACSARAFDLANSTRDRLMALGR